MESSSMHGQFIVGGGLSSTLFSDPTNLEAILSFSPSPAVNLQVVVTLLSISLGSHTVGNNSTGDSMLHGVSVDHSLIPPTGQSSKGVPSKISSKRGDNVHTTDLNKQGSGDGFQVPSSRSTSRLEYRPVSKIQSLVPVSNAFATIHQDIVV
ncbi:hypothetical protein QYF36_026636 [Acer negundo]|nr:hypothetical protein QYF36_026636 [Acer negundo]